jgi:hypothetical protein
MDRTPNLDVPPDQLKEALVLIEQYLNSLDCVKEVKVTEDGSIQYKHAWSRTRFIAEAIKQFFKGDYRPGLDIHGAIQRHLAQNGINSMMESWE